MTVKKVDLDQQGWTYSSYVTAGDYIFTSICSGWGDTIEEQCENAILQLQKYVYDAQATLDDVVKVTVTFKRGQRFDDLKEVFRKYFANGFPARNTILVDEFLDPNTLLQIEAIVYKPQQADGGAAPKTEEHALYQRIVCFTFKETASEEEIQQHCRDFAQLKEKIPQILTYTGGRSVETAVDNEPQWATVHHTTFASISDIETYFHHPAHQEFIQRNKHLWDNVLVCNSTIE